MNAISALPVDRHFDCMKKCQRTKYGLPDCGMKLSRCELMLESRQAPPEPRPLANDNAAREYGARWYTVEVQPRGPYQAGAGWMFWGNYKHRADAMTQAQKYAPARVLEVTLIREIRKGRT